MLKLVLFSLIMFKISFALTSEEFFKPIDLEKIEKFTPENNEVIKYGGDHKGFVDVDGDLADDRLENIFKKEKTHVDVKKYYYRKLYMLLYTKRNCKSFDESLTCQILIGSDVARQNSCPSRNKHITKEVSDLISSLIVTGYYTGVVLSEPEVVFWIKKNKKKLLTLNFDCKE